MVFHLSARRAIGNKGVTSERRKAISARLFLVIAVRVAVHITEWWVLATSVSTEWRVVALTRTWRLGATAYKCTGNVTPSTGAGVTVLLPRFSILPQASCLIIEAISINKTTAA